MKRASLIFVVLLLFSSLSFAVINYTKEDAQDQVGAAKDTIEDAEAALEENEADYSDYFERCPEVLSDWNEALAKLDGANDDYDDAFEDYTLENYNDSFEEATEAIENANEVIRIIEGLPARVHACEWEERRQVASESITNATNAKNSVHDAVMEKMICPEVAANWSAAQEQLTLANTHYTGGDYVAAREAANRAKEGYEAAGAAAAACVQPAPPPEEPEIECEANIHCGDDEICEEGRCVQIECECGYVSNHVCRPYECCGDRDCPSGYICSDHVCVEYEAPVAKPPVAPPVEEEAEAPPEGGICGFSFMVLLTALFGVVISRAF